VTTITLYRIDAIGGLSIFYGIGTGGGASAILCGGFKSSRPDILEIFTARGFRRMLNILPDAASIENTPSKSSSFELDFIVVGGSISIGHK
jgi:hypothetical protein